MGRLAGSVQLLHPGAEHGPVVGHHGRQHGRHAHHNHHRRDLDLGCLFLEHFAAQRFCVFVKTLRVSQGCPDLSSLQLLDVWRWTPRGSRVFFAASPHLWRPLSDLLLAALSFSFPALWWLVQKKRGPDNGALVSTSLLSCSPSLSCLW